MREVQQEEQVREVQQEEQGRGVQQEEQVREVQHEEQGREAQQEEQQEQMEQERGGQQEQQAMPPRSAKVRHGMQFSMKLGHNISASVKGDNLRRAQSMLAQVPATINLSEFEVVAVAHHSPTLFLQRCGHPPLSYDGGVLYDGKVDFPSEFPKPQLGMDASSNMKPVQACLFGRALISMLEGQSETVCDDSMVAVGVHVKKQICHMVWMVHLPSSGVFRGSVATNPSVVSPGGKLSSVTHNKSTVDTLLSVRKAVLDGTMTLSKTSKKKARKATPPAATPPTTCGGHHQGEGGHNAHEPHDMDLDDLLLFSAFPTHSSPIDKTTNGLLSKERTKRSRRPTHAEHKKQRLLAKEQEEQKREVQQEEHSEAKEQERQGQQEQQEEQVREVQHELEEQQEEQEREVQQEVQHELEEQQEEQEREVQQEVQHELEEQQEEQEQQEQQHHQQQHHQQQHHQQQHHHQQQRQHQQHQQHQPTRTQHQHQQQHHDSGYVQELLARIQDLEQTAHALPSQQQSTAQGALPPPHMPHQGLPRAPYCSLPILLSPHAALSPYCSTSKPDWLKLWW